MAKLLKNLYNRKYILILARSIKKNHFDFDIDLFETTVFSDDWDEKELKQRMRHIAITLQNFLPDSYEKSINILMSAFKT